MERIGHLAYKLDLPPEMRIHPVISVAHLIPAGKDAPTDPEPGHVEADQAEGSEADLEWEVERIVGKRVHYGKPQYLVKWIGYGHGRNMWRGLDDLQGCKEFVTDYNGGRHAARYFRHSDNRRTTITSMSSPAAFGYRCGR